MKISDISGKVFSSLTVLRFDEMNKFGAAMWLCRCACGTEKSVQGAFLRSGQTKSCGCLRKTSMPRKHGLAGTAEYAIWTSMKQRCTNPNNADYARYGKRGVSVCDRWMISFENFISDMGLRPSPGHSIDRANNDGDYCPENCRWADRYAQATNKGVRKDNVTGATGVCHGEYGGFIAQIQRNGVNRHIGTFKSIGEAKSAYSDAAEAALTKE